MCGGEGVRRGGRGNGVVDCRSRKGVVWWSTDLAGDAAAMAMGDLGEMDGRGKEA